MAELKVIIEEKNRIIEELKYIIGQKESIINELKEKISHSHNNSLNLSSHHSDIIQKETTILKTSGSGSESLIRTVKMQSSFDPIKDAPKYVSHLIATDKHSDAKDQIIRDFMQIIAHQLDWRRVTTTNPIIKRLLRPHPGFYHFDDGVYNGEMILGEPNGRGKTVLNNGDHYEGEYMNGKKNGKGTYHWVNGDVYDGDHVDGHEHGKGVYRYADGDLYIGDYLHGKRHGFGMLRLESGSTEYGYFKDGQYNGKCIMISPDEQVVSIGELMHNKQDGNWKYYNLRNSQAFSNGQKVI